ncbi:hypothetical protein R2F25_22340 [Streptomyces sp. UP1A-1]|nr:hypothetical protein [Streptomyces sp. UP1A-1]
MRGASRSVHCSSYASAQCGQRAMCACRSGLSLGLSGRIDSSIRRRKSRQRGSPEAASRVRRQDRASVRSAGAVPWATSWPPMPSSTAVRSAGSRSTTPYQSRPWSRDGSERKAASRGGTGQPEPPVLRTRSRPGSSPAERSSAAHSAATSPVSSSSRCRHGPPGSVPRAAWRAASVKARAASWRAADSPAAHRRA